MKFQGREVYRLQPSNDPGILEKAEALLPKVRFLEKGVFVVGSENGQKREYKVLIKRENGEFWASCTCPHFQRRLIDGEEAEPCKHIQAALIWGTLKEAGKLEDVLAGKRKPTAGGKEVIQGEAGREERRESEPLVVERSESQGREGSTSPEPVREGSAAPALVPVSPDQFFLVWKGGRVYHVRVTQSWVTLTEVWFAPDGATDPRRIEIPLDLLGRMVKEVQRIVEARDRSA